MRHKFKAWNVDHEDDSAEEVLAYDAREAAEEIVKQNFSHWDYPTYVTVNVVDKDGEKTTWDVSVAAVPEFSATPYRAPKKVT